MSSFKFCLLCDGTSDFCIQDIVQWIMDEHFPATAFRVIVAADLVPANGQLQRRLDRAYTNYRPDLIICHRDAEGPTLEERNDQIIAAAEAAAIPAPVVPAIPIRMLESWLLADEHAIRCAADNANGITPLNLPKSNRIEGIRDPKAVLFEALRNASGLPPNRLRKFNEGRARSRITGFITDFSPLRVQHGFSRFEAALVEHVEQTLAG